MENTEKSSINYDKNIKTWPIFAIAFIKTFYISLFGLALKNYLIFDRDISPFLVGTISSAQPIAYIFAPFIGAFITKKVGGIRNAIIISSFSSTIALGIQILPVDPWILITIRVIDGIMMGLFWPNFFLQLSEWQQTSSKEKSDKNFKNFNYSWSFGLCLGFLTGFLLAVFGGNDFFVLLAGFFLSFILVPISFLIKKSVQIKNPQKISLNVELLETTDSIRMEAEAETYKTHKFTMHISSIGFPILLSWIGMLIVTINKSILNFVYPYLLNKNIDYLVYIVVLFMQLGQITGINLVFSRKPSIKRYAYYISVFLIIIISSILLYNHEVWVASLLIAAVGLCFGLIHGASQKIMVDYGASTGSSVYSMMNEVVVGIGFGITPLIAGYIIEWSIPMVFIFQMILTIILLIFSIPFLQKFKK
ncbi:MAG: MFS transporter [Promethearchaeota archaeon]